MMFGFMKRKPVESPKDRERRADREYKANYEKAKAKQKANPDSRSLFVHPMFGDDWKVVAEDWVRDGLIVAVERHPRIMGWEGIPRHIYGELALHLIPAELQANSMTLEVLEALEAKVEEGRKRRDRALAKGGRPPVERGVAEAVNEVRRLYEEGR